MVLVACSKKRVRSGPLVLDFKQLRVVLDDVEQDAVDVGSQVFVDILCILEGLLQLRGERISVTKTVTDL